MTEAERKERLRETIAAARMMPAIDFVQAHVIDGEAYVFDWESRLYQDFKSSMGALLGVPIAGVGLVGSAKLGFSLNQDHLLRRFSSSSDLDLVIVDSNRFDAAVLELRTRASEFKAASAEDKHRWRKSSENVANGFLRPDRLPLGCKLLTELFPLLAGPFDDEPARSHQVRAWLFKSWDFARLLYSDHLQVVSPKLNQVSGPVGGSNAHSS